jgi:hypothetical protein
MIALFLLLATSDPTGVTNDQTNFVRNAAACPRTKVRFHTGRANDCFILMGQFPPPAKDSRSPPPTLTSAINS